MAKIGVVRASSIAGADARVAWRGLLAALGASMLAACATQTSDFSAGALNFQDAFSPAMAVPTFGRFGEGWHQ